MTRKLSTIEVALILTLTFATIFLVVAAINKRGTCKLCEDRPPDVEVLGHSAWTLIHTMAGTYPNEPTREQQGNMRQFLWNLAQFYPCRLCGTHLQQYLSEHPADVSTRTNLEQWLCVFHNNVNARLQKPSFDCSKIHDRWGSH
jgi:FAD-linked sulfhydryl oxidase